MLYLQTVTPTLLDILRKVSAAPYFQSFRLVGGTGLSLYLGHRMSVDADFFTTEPFHTEEAIEELSHLFPSFMVLKKSPHGFAGHWKNVKIDLYQWGMPFLLPSLDLEGIRIADMRDIAALKLEAIIQRKEEKDFRDVGALLQKFSLKELIAFYEERYPHNNPKMVTDHLLAAPFVERDWTVRLVEEKSWSLIGEEIQLSIEHYYNTRKVEREASEAQKMKERINRVKKKNNNTD